MLKVREMFVDGCKDAKMKKNCLDVNGNVGANILNYISVNPFFFSVNKNLVNVIGCSFYQLLLATV
jgi:hypothetical protein